MSLTRRVMLAGAASMALLHLIDGKAVSPWDAPPSREKLLAMPEPGPNAPPELVALWHFVRLSPAAQDTVVKLLEKLPHFLAAAGAKGMSLNEAIRAGLIIEEHRDGWLIYHRANARPAAISV